MKGTKQMAKKTKEKKKPKTKDTQEYISCLWELHKLQGVLLKKLDKSLPKKIQD